MKDHPGWRGKVVGWPRIAPSSRMVLLGLVGMLVVGGAVFWLRRPAPAILPPSPAPAVRLALAAPASLAAGEVLTVTVYAAPVEGDSLPGDMAVLLTAQGVNGPWAGRVPLAEGAATFTLPMGWTQGAGAATLRASLAGRGDTAAMLPGRVVTATVVLRPGPAANPLLALTGPVSVRVDAATPPQLVALPLDVRGNAVSGAWYIPGNDAGQRGGAVGGDGSGEDSGNNGGVTVRVQHPSMNGQAAPTDQYAAVERGLLAVARLFTRHTAGLLTAAASMAPSSAAPAFSPLQSVRVMPGAVLTPTVNALPATVPAGSSAVVQLTTGLLQDRYGNVLPDGTLVTFVVDAAPPGSVMAVGASAATFPGSLAGDVPNQPPARLPAIVVAGRATAPLAAPAGAGTATVRALVGTVATAPVTVTFTAPPALPGFGLVATVDAEGQGGDLALLRAGPARDDLGAYLPDGTPVRFTVTAPGGTARAYTAGTHYGYAELALPLDGSQPGVYQAVARLGDAQATATYIVPQVWQ